MADKTYSLIVTVGASSTTVMVAEDGSATRTVSLATYEKQAVLDITVREFAALQTLLNSKLT